MIFNLLVFVIFLIIGAAIWIYRWWQGVVEFITKET